MFGEILRNLRKEADITQEELGNIVGVTTSMIGMYETNARKPSYEVLLKIAEYFNVTTDYLLGKSDSKTSNNKLAEQEKYIESIRLDTAEDAMKFILQQPSLMAFGGYDLNEMTEEEILDLANDMLFAMKLSLEKNKRK
ncbi:MAG TPA: XRE family transcriptional regulator [Tissierella sp.]|uniref:helix-turn-helix domain-containing protein n=1 Tax=Tissierella praeacuta TaxID=43131 RepID=UPI000ED2B767|nr:helix-turn-helix transcriptional regulator [Tissierella praeacuta]HAE91684.1 XRE family transcriptional regulator [Tissierella sp.]